MNMIISEAIRVFFDLEAHEALRVFPGIFLLSEEHEASQVISAFR